MKATNEEDPPRVVVITGAAAGVGRAVAHRFARAGAALALIARDEAALEDVQREVAALGGSARAFALDVADADAVEAAAGRIEEQLGPIAIWINDAMVTVFSPLSEMTAEEFRRVTEVTYLGFVYGTMAALRRMRPRNRGTIVQVGSSLAYRGIPLQSAYCGAKHAIRGFTDSLRSELIHDKCAVRLTMVQLPAMNTPQFDWARTHLPRRPRPVAPVFDPAVAADAIFRAASGNRREVWLGTSTAKVIIGSMLLPGFLDRFLARNAVCGQERDEPVSPDRRDNLFAPVHSLHATRGDFGREAAGRAVSLPGGAVPLLLAMGGIAAAALAGFAAGARTRHGGGRRRR